MTDAQLRVLRLRSGAKLPIRAGAGAASRDHHADWSAGPEPSGSTSVIRNMAPLWPGERLALRYGLALSHGTDVVAGVVDASCRGEVRVVLLNPGKEGVRFRQGDRIAQLVLVRVATPDLLEIKALDAKERGAGEFGSPGGTAAG